MARYRTEIQGEASGTDMPEEGWTRWLHPLPGYRMACCDCGLVHEVQFKTHLEGNVLLMRVRRLNRSTAAKRRHMKPKA